MLKLIRRKGIGIHLPSSLAMLFSAISLMFPFCFYEDVALRRVEISMLIFTELHLLFSDHFFN